MEYFISNVSRGKSISGIAEDRMPVQYSITVLYDCTVTGDDSVSFVVLYINYPAYVVFAAQLCIFSVGIYLELQKPQGQ